jgi:hypothetical protein
MKGWVRACFTATAAIELCFMFGLLVPVPRFSAGGVVAIVFWMFALAPLVWLVTSALTGIPALLAIRLSERFRIQSVLFLFVSAAGSAPSSRRCCSGLSLFSVGYSPRQVAWLDLATGMSRDATPVRTIP